MTSSKCRKFEKNYKKIREKSEKYSVNGKIMRKKLEKNKKFKKKILLIFSIFLNINILKNSLILPLNCAKPYRAYANFILDIDRGD